jgi:hypothetical protein
MHYYNLIVDIITEILNFILSILADPALAALELVASDKF